MRFKGRTVVAALVAVLAAGTAAAEEKEAGKDAAAPGAAPVPVLELERALVAANRYFSLHHPFRERSMRPLGAKEAAVAEVLKKATADRADAVYIERSYQAVESAGWGLSGQHSIVEGFEVTWREATLENVTADLAVYSRLPLQQRLALQRAIAEHRYQATCEPLMTVFESAYDAKGRDDGRAAKRRDDPRRDLPELATNLERLCGAQLNARLFALLKKGEAVPVARVVASTATEQDVDRLETFLKYSAVTDVRIEMARGLVRLKKKGAVESALDKEADAAVRAKLKQVLLEG